MSIEITAEIIRQTEKAYRVKCGNVECWLPKSQVDAKPLPSGGDNIYTIDVPSWLAKDKNLTL